VANGNMLGAQSINTQKNLRYLLRRVLHIYKGSFMMTKENFISKVISSVMSLKA